MSLIKVEKFVFGILIGGSQQLYSCYFSKPSACNAYGKEAGAV